MTQSKVDELREANLELVLEILEAHEDRKILAKQLRNERSFSSALCDGLLATIKELHKTQERIEQLELTLWEATNPPETDDFFEEPDQWAARHGLY